MLSKLEGKKTWREAFRWKWRFFARTDQIPPAWLWDVWLILAGRGWGKTRTGAEWVLEKAEENPGCIIFLVGPTYDDVRKTMIEGESGILKRGKPHFLPDWQPGNKRILFPNGSMALVFGAENPDRIRGKQGHFAWCDEKASWRFREETWDQINMALRLGRHEGIHPQIVVTTTPRPLPDLREMVKDVKHVHTTRGRTWDNEHNLAKPTVRKLRKLQATGSDFARQELEADILDDLTGTLWTTEKLRGITLPWKERPKSYARVVVIADPAEEIGAGNDETGLLVVGLGWDKRVYVLEENTGRHEPSEWAAWLIAKAVEYGADILAETNRGGKMVTQCVRAALAKWRLSSGNRAWRPKFSEVKSIGGKGSRALPSSVCYDEDLVRHVGSHAKLENDQINFVPGVKPAKSPNTLDCLGIALAELLGLDKMNGGATMKFKPVGL